MRTVRVIVAVAALVIAVLPFAPAQAHSGIAMAGAQFVPAVAQGEVGHEIEWRNIEVIDLHHAVVPDLEIGTLPGFRPLPVESGELHGGEAWTWTPEEPGTYAYRCAEHPQMRGVLQIEGHAH